MKREHVTDPWLEERNQKGPHLTVNEHMGFNGRLALLITKRFGSMSTFYFLLFWMLGWVTLATLGIGVFRNDPYPFTFLLFLSNLIQLLSLPILAVGQQMQSKATDKQAKQTFKDAELLLKMQDEITRLVKLNTDLTEEIHRVVVQKKDSAN